MNRIAELNTSLNDLFRPLVAVLFSVAVRVVVALVVLVVFGSMLAGFYALFGGGFLAMVLSSVVTWGLFAAGAWVLSRKG